MTGSEVAIAVVLAYFLLKKKPVTTTVTTVAPTMPAIPVMTVAPPTSMVDITTIYPTPQAALTSIPTYVPGPSGVNAVTAPAVAATPIVMPIDDSPTIPAPPTPVATLTPVRDPGPPAVYYGIYFMQPTVMPTYPGLLWDSFSKTWVVNVNPSPAIAGVNTGGAAVLVPSVPDIMTSTPNTSSMVIAYTRFPYYSITTDNINISIVPNVNQ